MLWLPTLNSLSMQEGPTMGCAAGVFAAGQTGRRRRSGPGAWSRKSGIGCAPGHPGKGYREILRPIRPDAFYTWFCNLKPAQHQVAAQGILLRPEVLTLNSCSCGDSGFGCCAGHLAQAGGRLRGGGVQDEPCQCLDWTLRSVRNLSPIHSGTGPHLPCCTPAPLSRFQNRAHVQNRM